MRALLYHLPLGEMDGSSVVLRRVYAPEAGALRHLYFRDGRFPVPTEFASERCQGFPVWPWRIGANSIPRKWRKLALPLRLRRSPMTRALKTAARAGQLTSIHVVFYDEATAACARIALQALGCPPFTLHVMDFFYERALAPDFASEALWLLARAKKIAVVSRRLGEALRPFSQAPQLVWPIPSGFAPLARTTPLTSAARWQVLIGGAMYAGKTAFLEEVFMPAWGEFHATRPDTELVYLGKDLEAMPSSARAAARHLGVVAHDKVGATLGEAAVALVPVLHAASDAWRYSVPARISDYMAAGLPTLAPRSEGTATHDFLEEIGRPTVTLAGTRAEILDTLIRLHDDREHWFAASRAASEFARARLDLAVLRPQLLEFLT